MKTKKDYFAPELKLFKLDAPDVITSSKNFFKNWLTNDSDDGQSGFEEG